jgi:hypothetical protein
MADPIDRMVPDKGETVYYVAPSNFGLHSPLEFEAAIVVKIHRDATGAAQENLALDLAVFSEDPTKPLAVRRTAVAYHPYKDVLTNPGNTWHWRFEGRIVADPLKRG